MWRRLTAALCRQRSVERLRRIAGLAASSSGRIAELGRRGWLESTFLVFFVRLVDFCGRKALLDTQGVVEVSWYHCEDVRAVNRVRDSSGEAVGRKECSRPSFRISSIFEHFSRSLRQ